MKKHPDGRPPGRGIRRSGFWKPYLFLLPLVTAAVLFCYYPALRAFFQSFAVVSARGEARGFAGFENYRYLLRSKSFRAALRNTLVLSGSFTVLNLLLSLGMALLAGRKRALSPLYETMFALPMAVSMPALCLIFKALLNPTVGIVNRILGIGWGWFEDQRTALFGILLICLWMGVSLDFLLFLSALRAVPDSMLEAARLDGAGSVRRFFFLVLPRISPTVLYVVCSNLSLAMMTSGPVLILTQGGPNRSTTTLIQLMYTAGYGSSNYSLASCISVVTFLLTVGATLLAFLFERRAVSYD